MANLGELFIQLGVIGDIKPLEDALNKTKEQIALTQTQVRLDNARAKALEKIRQATKRADKQRIAKAYQTEKQLILQQAQEAGIKRQISAHKALGKEVGKVATGFVAFIGAVTAAAVAMNKLTNDLVQSNQAFLNLTRTSDIALSTFQKWDNVGKMFGVQNAAQQIEGLNQRLFELRLTGQGARGFQLAGINPAGDADGVMEQLRGRVAGMSDTAASYLLQQMGLDPQMLHILRLGREEFEALGQTVRKYQLTPEQSKNIQQMNVQLQIAAIKLQYLKDRAVLALMPYWVKFVQSLARVTEGLARVGKWLTSTKLGIVSLAGTITTVLIPAIRALYVALSSHPIVALITALLGSLYLLIDDIVGYYQGKDSGIGALLYLFDEIDAKINGIDTPQWVKDLLALFKNGNNFLAAWNDIDNARNGGTVKTSNVQKMNTVLKYSPFGGLLKPMTQLIDAVIGLQSTIEILNRHLGKNGIATGGAAGIPANGYEGTLSDLSHRGIVSPATEQVINNNNNTVSSTTSNPQITQTNYIQTNQPANDIERELAYINMRVSTTG